MTEVWSAAGAGVVVGALLVWAALQAVSVRARRAGSDRPTDELLEQETAAVAEALEDGGEVYLPTGRLDEFVVYSTRDRAGHDGAVVPTDLARTAAAGVSAALQGGVEAAKATGRLVMVDGATAKAIREGALATDKAGKSLAVVRGAGGKFEHMARLTPSAGKVAGTALGAANVLGAVSTQMQMASIEAKLTDIVDGVRALESIAHRELAASIVATRQLLSEVVGASRETGHLPAESWAQIAPHYKAIIEDQQMAVGAVEDLIAKARTDPKGFWLKTRSRAVETNRDVLVERMEALKEADLNVLRMHMVRLRHYVVTQPELAGYFERLASQEIVNQGEVESRLVAEAQATISQHGELDRLERIFHWREGDDYRRRIESFSRISALGASNAGAIEAGKGEQSDDAMTVDAGGTT